MRTLSWISAGLAVSCLALVLPLGQGCGGKAVLDAGDGSGAAGAGSGASTGNASANGGTTMSGPITVTSGPGPCTDHDDCPGGVCIFESGQCSIKCELDFCETCGSGEICDDCGTSSCPNCKDCVAACVAITEPGRCDDHDDCADDELCIYGQQQCAPTCESPNCADPNLVCVDCATSSCPCCEDCGSACLPL